MIAESVHSLAEPAERVSASVWEQAYTSLVPAEVSIGHEYH